MSEPVATRERKFLGRLVPPAATPAARLPRTQSMAMRAIKAKCRECVAGSADEIKRCLATPANSRVCELHRFLRKGKQGRRT